MLRTTFVLPNVAAGGGGVGLKSAGVIAQSGAAVSHTGDAAEFTLATIPIPAGTLGANGQLRLWTVWSVTNSANNKILRARVGATAIQSVTLTTTLTAQLYYALYNRGVTNSQVGFVNFTSSPFGTNTNAVNTYALDFSQAQTLTITGQLANSGETVALEAYCVEVLNP